MKDLGGQSVYITAICAGHLAVQSSFFVGWVANQQRGPPMKSIEDCQQIEPTTADNCVVDRLIEAEDHLPLLSEIRSAPGQQPKARLVPVSRWRERGLLTAAVVGIAVVTMSAVGLAWWGVETLSTSTSAPAATADPILELSPEPQSTIPAQMATTTQSSPDVAAVVDGQCRELRDGAISVSSGRGGVSGGAAVIERFSFNVYVLRSASAARSVVDVHGAVATTPALQQWINSRPQGTRHCVKVTDRGNGVWAVETTEIRPTTSETQRFYQIVRTHDDPSSRTWITSISADPKKGK